MLKNILKRIIPKIQEFEYGNLYSSRTVIKNQYINKEATAGYYGEDIWGIVDKEVKDKIEPGISLYGEIVGFLPSGKHIQKGYDYGCDSVIDFGRHGSTTQPSHKFLVYRITYTKPDGNVIEFSWQQIKNYCQKYQLEHVKELYFGKASDLRKFLITTTDQQLEAIVPISNNDVWRDEVFKFLQTVYLEKDCKYCVNKVPAEGIVVRRDGLETYSAYKLKSKRFLEKESKQLDEEAKSGEINIEDNETTSNNL